MIRISAYKTISLLLICCQMWGQELLFEDVGHLVSELSSTTNVLLQDRSGFIWAGTTDGLKKYDGKNVKTYYSIRGDSTSLSNNYIKSLFEDDKGVIWIGTKMGLCAYDPETEMFKQYVDETKELQIHSIVKDSKGYVWCGTYEGVLRFKPGEGELQHFQSDPNNSTSLSNNVVWTIFEDRKEKVWFCTNDGVSVFVGDEANSFERYYPGLQSDIANTKFSYWSMDQSQDGTIWVGSNMGAFAIIESAAGFKFRHYSSDGHLGLSGDFVQSVHVHENQLFLGTYNDGLNEITLDEKGIPTSIHHYRTSGVESSSIQFDRINHSIHDEGGLLWVATSTGIDKARSTSNNFKIVKHDIDNLNSLSHNIIKAVEMDKDGNLFIGTYNGLNVLSAKDFANKNYEFVRYYGDEKSKESLNHSNIYGLTVDSENRLWVGTFQGLSYADLNDGIDNLTFQTYTSKHGLSHWFVYGITEVLANRYMIATYGELSKMTFDPSAHDGSSFVNYSQDDDYPNTIVNSTTYKVEQDKFGYYWIATFDGLSRFTLDADPPFFENYQLDRTDQSSLSNNSTIDIFRDSKDRLWIGTRNGLNLVLQDDPENRATFLTFDYSHGFNNTVIQSIEEDRNGNLWLGTNAGIIHFDPELALKNQDPVIRIYGKGSGIVGSGQVFRASYQDSKGMMYFGSSNGLNIFDPDKIVQNEHEPRLAFTRLEVNNKVITPSSHGDVILEQSINQTSSISLDHNQNNIVFEWAAIDYVKPELNQYAYMLEGFNVDWITIKYQNTATFTNLSPGHYTFKIKGSNNDGLWTTVQRQIEIRIHAPWWSTWWAYLLYTTGIGLVIYGYITYQVERRTREVKTTARIKAARNEEHEKMRKQNAADFHDELGHRITKISLFLEMAQRELTPSSKALGSLKKIRLNVGSLSDGIRDLIWSLDPEKDTLEETMYRLQEFGDRLFEFTPINFKTEQYQSDLAQQHLDLNTRKHIILLFKEVMNNTLKYSKADNVILSVKVDGSAFHISYKDDGIGYDLANSDSGYGLSNIKERAKKINGQLDVKSKEGEGVSVVLQVK